jgi:hypothetical protein
MEILINELSLSGQFESIEQFIDKGLKPFIGMMSDIDRNQNQLYKRYDFYNYRVTENASIHDVLVGKYSRQYDEIRKFKSQLSSLFDKPHWEETSKQKANDTYLFKNQNISKYSIAEACERDKLVASFTHIDFELQQLSILKNGKEIILDNLFEKGHFIEIAYKRRLILFEDYCRKKFTGSKLNFSQISEKEGFLLLLKKGDEGLFFDGFRKFTELSWQQIAVNDALDYKEYNNKKPFQGVTSKIYKFRITQKYRCFGYVSDGVFYVLAFDLGHKLSDIG